MRRRADHEPTRGDVVKDHPVIVSNPMKFMLCLEQEPGRSWAQFRSAERD